MLDKFTILAMINWKRVDKEIETKYTKGLLSCEKYATYQIGRKAVHIALTRGDADLTNEQRNLIDGDILMYLN